MLWCLVTVAIFMGLGGAKRRVVRNYVMVPCNSCHIYGICRSKEAGKVLKSSFGVAMQATRRGNFYGKEGFSLCNTVVLNLYCKSYWVL